jgi:hypothetical protein
MHSVCFGDHGVCRTPKNLEIVFDGDVSQSRLGTADGIAGLAFGRSPEGRGGVALVRAPSTSATLAFQVSQLSHASSDITRITVI